MSKRRPVTAPVMAARNLQKERQQRGANFEEELRRSWRLLGHCWRYKLREGGGERPADNLILLQDCNILAEYKRTNGLQFKLNMLRPNQLQGLLDFDEVIDRNYGIVIISFLNDKKDLDTCYAFRLLTALQFMKRKNRVSIRLDEFEHKKVTCMHVPRIYDAAERTYDLGGIVECYRYL